MPDVNPFDQFDAPAPTSSAAPAAGANPFDQFDAAPSTPVAPAAPQRSVGSQVLHQGAQLAKGAANAVAALPLMAMDAGVGARNLIGKYVPSMGSNYELPSQTWHEGMNQIFGAPENTGEKINDAVLPVIMGMGAASAEAPAAIRALMSGPEAASQVPSNFVSAADTKRQLLARTIKSGQDLGLVVPPQTTNPGALNAAVETVGGKIQTAQAASIHNQAAANSAAIADLTKAGAVGLNPDAPLTVPALTQVIKDAGQGYQAVRNTGQITVGQKYLQTLSDVADQAAGPAASFPGSKPSPLVGEVDSLLQPSFDASHAVDKIAELRDASSVAFREGDSRLSSGYRRLATALEDQIDEGISQNPNIDPNTVANFRSSRVLAAKAHNVLDALNPSTGDVSIQSLAKSGEPLTGNLKTLADFGNAAPKATQDAAKIGSHGVSHLDMLGTLFTSTFGAHEAGPWGAIAGAAYPAARWGSRAYALGRGQANAIPKIAPTSTSAVPAAGAVQGLKEVSDATQRSSGGKVDMEALITRLMKRWKAAKVATDQTTRPLLGVHDDTIAKALEIAGRPL